MRSFGIQIGVLALRSGFSVLCHGRFASYGRTRVSG
jgi:hypothetical protein